MLKFSVDDVTVLDINKLIDKGYRFNVVVEDDDDVIKVEDYLYGETDVLSGCSVRDKGNTAGVPSSRGN